MACQRDTSRGQGEGETRRQGEMKTHTIGVRVMACRLLSLLVSLSPCLLVHALLVPSAANAASPSLGGIQPRGAQRGTDAVLTFSGARLADAQEVLIYYPGITVKKLEVVNDATLKVTVGI